MFHGQYKMPADLMLLKDEILKNVCVNEVDENYDHLLSAMSVMFLKDRTTENVDIWVGYARSKANIKEDVEYHDLSIVIFNGEKDEGKNLETAPPNDIFDSPNWRNMPDLELYVKKFYTGIRFFSNETENKFCVFVNRAFVFEVYHLICALFPRLLPWIFRDKPLTPWEQEFIKSLTLSSKNETQKLLTEYFETKEFRVLALKKRIGSMTKKIAEKEIASQRTLVDSLRNKMNEILERYEDAYNNFNESNIRLNGLIMGSADMKDDDELVSYLTNTDNIKILSSPDTYCNDMEIICKGYLTNVDADTFEEYAANQRSFLYNLINTSREEFNTAKKRIDFLKELFGQKPRFKLRVCGYYYFMGLKNIRSASGFDYGPGYETYMPNPHLDFFACLGEYGSLIDRKLLENDIVGALDLCQASVSSMNITESTTVTRFMSRLFEYRFKCIEDRDGKLYTPYEAARLLQDE